MAAPCYTGPNPVKDDERYAIWKWAKENGIDHGASFEKISGDINDFFFGGQAKPEWISDILSGRKTPFRTVANDVWKKQFNRRVVTQEAKEIQRVANMGPVGKILKKIWWAPRSLAVAGHGIVFPITHAGDLAFRPASWGTFVKGLLRTYRAGLPEPITKPFAGGADVGRAYTERIKSMISRDEMYDTAIRSGVDVGPGSHATGLLSKSSTGTPAGRAWDILSVMRFELWKKQMDKFVKPGMSEAEVLDVGKNLADWANHATGSGKGVVAKVGGEVLFGPKLTQAKINRLSIDPAKTVNTFLDYKNATAGEKAAAWTRLSGATQLLVTNLGFLGVNAGVLAWANSKDKINFTDPTKSDFLAFKGNGITGNVPGLHTEIRTLGKVLATAFASKKELRGESKFGATAKIGGQYGMGKLTPTIQKILEVGLGENWMGRPLPWSNEKGDDKHPKMTYPEYAAASGPIPLSGPIGYVFDHIKQSGASSKEALSITKALIIGGLGAPGFHVHESYDTPEKKKPGGDRFIYK